MQQRGAEAAVSLRQTLEVCRTMGDPLSVALAPSFYAAALGAEGDYDTAARSLGEALDLFRPILLFCPDVALPRRLGGARDSQWED